MVIGNHPIITYNSVGNSGHINLDYSTDGGVTWNVIATNTEDDGDWQSWTVPNTPSANCKIRVSDSDGSPSVISDGFFTITSNEFTEQTSISLPSGMNSSAAWGDYDNDGDLDILLTGIWDVNTGEYLSKIYRNDGNNTFTEQTSISLAGFSVGRGAWGDYDNDGNLDILISGRVETWFYYSIIYRNNGDNTFTEQTNIEGYDGAWGDYDNDGDLDLISSMYYDGGGWVTKIYRNNGDNTFSEQTSLSLSNPEYGSETWRDYDNDGDLDIIVRGNKIYRNNGDNTFTEQTSISFANGSSVAWGDYDNDGNPDILLSGDSFCKIYRNNGNNSFTEQISIILSTDVTLRPAVWGDYDNDGDLDILLTGLTEGGISVSKIYRNNGNNTFTEQTSIVFSWCFSGFGNAGEIMIMMVIWIFF